MTPEQLEALIATFATVDRRLSALDARSINIESNMAESASATDNIAASVHKLSELYVSIDEIVNDLKTVMQNYVAAVREQLRQAKLATDAAKGLVSTIREKCPDAAGT